MHKIGLSDLFSGGIPTLPAPPLCAAEHVAMSKDFGDGITVFAGSPGMKGCSDTEKGIRAGMRLCLPPAPSALVLLQDWLRNRVFPPSRIGTGLRACKRNRATGLSRSRLVNERASVATAECALAVAAAAAAAQEVSDDVGAATNAVAAEAGRGGGGGGDGDDDGEREDDEDEDAAKLRKGDGSDGG